MATLEKLSKALEALKNTISSTLTTDDTGTRNKEKVCLCIHVADLICLPETKTAQNFSPHLAYAMESLFIMCDDQDSNVRMVADESLNRIIRSLMDGHVAKVNLELHNEIKKNRNARSLRSALTKFAELAHTIRPVKRKAFIQNMACCIKNIAKRQEESVLETLATSLGKFLVPLGCFLTDSEVKELLQVFMKNIVSENAVFRRTAASSILALCLKCSNPQFFLVHTINTLLESVVPVKDDQSVYTILGVLNCIRGLLGHLESQTTETGLRGSFGLKRKQKKESVLSVDSIIQVFELCLHWTHHQDHNVITAALETLNELLISPPPKLVPILLNQQGLSRSRIYSANVGWKLSVKTLSDISVATTIPLSEDLNFLEAEDIPPPRTNLSGWLEDGSITGSQSTVTTASHEKSGPASVNQDSLQDFQDCASVMSEDFSPAIGKPGTSQTPDHDLYYSRESPSPPLDSFIPLAWDIGELTDSHQSPLLYTARKLVTAFLIPECGSVRVSVRSLAITCLSQVVRLSPSIFFQPVDKNGLTTSKGFSHICDIMCFANHSDQQLRGLIRLLIGNLIHSLFNQANYGPLFFPEKNINLEEFINILIMGIQDESSVCIRHSLSALVLCLPDIMDSCHYENADMILDKLLTVTLNPYWLVKVKLVELLCTLPFQCVYFIKGSNDYQSKVLNLIIHDFLANEDNRVRKTTCDGIVKIVKNLHFPIDYGPDDVVVARGISLSSNIFSDSFMKGSDQIVHDSLIENTLSRVVDILVETLTMSSSKHLTFGCVEALSNLSEEYPPFEYPVSWQCCVQRNAERPSVDGGLFCIVVTLLTKSPISLDLECHQWLLKLASKLFIGLQQFLTEKAEEKESDNSRLRNAVDDLLTHVMRLMNIFVRVMEDSSPVRNSLSSPLKRRPITRSTSPSKNQAIAEKETEKDKDIKIRHLGVFRNIPHCQKLLETLRSGFTNYKLTLDSTASEKFLSLLRNTLGCLEMMLSPNNIIDSESFFEELLQYLRVSFVLDAECTVKVVFQLLRSLFETNLLGAKMPAKHESFIFSDKSFAVGFYKSMFQNPLFRLTKQCDQALIDIKQKLSQEGNEEKEKTPLSQSQRETLASRIKLFEAIVIQSLKEYTVTCNVRLQAQVLRLLTLLVQLKVNYCLLDSELVFIEFVLKQFTFLEAGQINDAEVLIPSIFQFLVHLSNEKNHSKPVISMPKIIQLCDGLMASGQNPVTHSIPALIPVVENVFFRCSNAADQKEVETQKEVLLAMLLRLAEYPQVLDFLCTLMNNGWKWEEHWQRWYKQTLDALSPLLAEGRLLTSDMSSLHSIFCLNRRLAVPLSGILMLLFSPQQESQTHSQWLGMVTVMLLSVSMYDEKKVLVDLEQLNLYVREEGDDPLKVRPVSKTLPPQSLLAKLLLRIIVTSATKLKSLIISAYKEENISDLEKSFSRFLLCCVLILQPDCFIEVSKSLCSLLSQSDLKFLQESFKEIAQSCQIPVLLWTQIMSIIDHGFQQWHSYYLFPKRLSLNQELVRRGTIMLHAEYLVKRVHDLEMLNSFLSSHMEDIIWFCHEPPIENFLSTIYNLVPNSKLLLENCSKCISIMEPVFTHRLLYTLEYIHSDFSGSVLKLVALSLVKYTNIAIARLAAAFCCRTIEFILSSENAVVKKQLSEEELRHIFRCLSLNQRLFKRHNGLIILLNKLGKQHYNISLCEFDDCVKPVSADVVRSIHFNKDWFIALVREKCSTESDCDKRKCAYLLSYLTCVDIENIMTSKEFDINILEHCFSCEIHNTLQEYTVNQGHYYDFPMFKCAQKIVFEKIREINQHLPSKYEIFNPNGNTSHELFQYFSSNDSIKCLLSLIRALKNFLCSVKNDSNEAVFDKSDCGALSRFGILCVEAISWFVFQMPNHELQHWPSVIQSMLECSAAVFRISCFSSLLTFEHISSICTSLMTLFQFITGEAVPMKTYKFSGLSTENETDVVLKTALQMVSIILWLEENSNYVPGFILHSSRSIVIALGRNHKLNWLCRIPVEAWQTPLDSPNPPTIPTQLLHDAEIINQIVSRIKLLGWRGKFQFEESWVCLLGALSPNPDFDNTDQEEVSAIMHANSLAIDGITWLVLSTLSCKSESMNETTYLHIPRHSNEKLYSLKFWKRLAEMNDILHHKLQRISGDGGIKLLRVDQRPNIERVDVLHRYGFAQVSVSYLQKQIKPPEDVEESTENRAGEKDFHEEKTLLLGNSVDIRSCVQFVLDLFSQWVLPHSGISLNLQLSMVKSILCISDLFMERNHFEWMLNIFLDLYKNHPPDDEIMHQYLVLGIAKSCAVLNYFEDEKSEQVLRALETALKSQFRPLQEAGIHGLLYLLQGTLNIEKTLEEGDLHKFKPQDFQQKLLQYSIDVIKNKNFKFNDDSLLLIALIFYLMEYYHDELPDSHEILKSLMNLVKTSGNGLTYRSILQGFERLILIGNYNLNDQITRLALERFSQADPNITIPALQLLLACIYADTKNAEKIEEVSEPWTIEIMEKVTALFDRIKKGYPIEVEIVCDILPGILSDFFCASDILTKVIGEFLSPNQPHKRNMAAMVFQVFTQACSEKQLSLLQDWVVYSLKNLTHNLPLMTAGWSLCCFFIGASTNPWLKAVFPLVQSRIRQCDYEDRLILCLSAVDFYSQLTPKQKEIFLESLRNTSCCKNSPFMDIITCL